MNEDEMPYTGPGSLRQAWEQFKQGRAPRDVVPQRRSDRPVPQGPTELTYVELDDDGTPRQAAETVWIARPFGGDDVA